MQCTYDRLWWGQLNDVSIEDVVACSETRETIRGKTVTWYCRHFHGRPFGSPCRHRHRTANAAALCAIDRRRRGEPEA